MKALVLCGGKGTRLRPLTYTVPKQLIPIANRPLVHYVMDHLRDANVREVGVVVAPETQDQFKRTFAENKWQFSFTFLLQERPLGLAHTLIIAKDFIGSSPFIMYLGDNLVGAGVRPLVDLFYRADADAVVLLKEVADPRRFGVAVLDNLGQLIKLIEKPQLPPSNLALVGVYVFSPAIFQRVEEIRPSARGELEITDAIQRLLETGGRVLGEQLGTWWLDCGKKDDLLEANRVVLDEWLQRDIRTQLHEGSRIVGRVVLGEGARVERSEVRGPAIVGSGTLIQDAFIGPFTSIGRDCIIRKTALEHSVILDGARVEEVGRIEDSVLGQNTIVRSLNGNHTSTRLLIGDDAEVLL